MPKGLPFPELRKLERAMVLLQWNRERLSKETGIHASIIGRLLEGKPVQVRTSQRVAETVVLAVKERPDPAMAEFQALAV